MQKSISLGSKTKAKLISFKNKHKCKSFSDAVELLLNQNKGKLIVSTKIEKKFREFRRDEKYPSDNEGIRILLTRYHKYGLPNLSPEELIDNHFKNYESSVSDVKIKSDDLKKGEAINQIKQVIRALEDCE